MELQDLITIALVLLCVWTFIPRHIRVALRSGLEPAVATLADTARDVSRVVAKVITHVAYRVLIGSVPMSSDATDDDTKRVEPEPLRSSDFPLPAAIEPQTNGSANLEELQLNATELAALHRMIEHNKMSVKPSKSSTIQAGFGVSRGGSTAYQRASMIYDALFGTPAPAVRYRQRTPEQDALRQQLGISKR